MSNEATSQDTPEISAEALEAYVPEVAEGQEDGTN